MLRVLGISAGIGLLVVMVIAVCVVGYQLINLLPLLPWAKELAQVCWVLGWLTTCGVAPAVWVSSQ